MSNKLADIFSDKEIVHGRISFCTSEDKKRFCTALDTAIQKGEVSRIEGISSISNTVSDGVGNYPVGTYNSVKEIWVGPNVDHFPLEIKTLSSPKKQIFFRRIYLGESTRLALTPGEIVSIVIDLNRNTLTTRLEYKVNKNNAKTMLELAEAFSDAFGIFSYLFKPDNEIAAPESVDSIRSIKAFFKTSYNYIRMMLDIEKEYGINFDPKQIDDLNNCARDIEELYYLICKKKKIRYDAEISSFETTNVVHTDDCSHSLYVGNKISVVFIQKRIFSILGVCLTAYTTNIFFNSHIKDILVDADTGQTRILYCGTDSTPLYVSYSGYLTEAEAKAELKIIMRKSEEYSRARTIIEYRQECNQI